jgi:hypothetical protein
VIISFNHIKGISALNPALEPVDVLKAAVPVPVSVVRVEEVQTEETTLSRPS